MSETTDEREHCLRRLAILMADTHSAQFYEFLDAREYGLALDELVALVNHHIDR